MLMLFVYFDSDKITKEVLSQDQRVAYKESVHTKRPRDRQKGRQIDRQTERHTNRQNDRQTQIDRHTGRQTDRYTDRRPSGQNRLLRVSKNVRSLMFSSFIV